MKKCFMFLKAYLNIVGTYSKKKKNGNNNNNIYNS